ncbi:MAG: NAD+ synthase, partial [Pyrinomonadaceae bacterium]
ITIGQINTTNGDYAGNIEKIIKAIEHARQDRSDLIVFPEIAVQGYTSFDWFLDRDMNASAFCALERVVEATPEMTAIVGTVRATESKEGRALYNSAAVISNRQIVGFADKILLPEYDVFDDPRYFEPGRSQTLFNVAGMRVGVAVCEDLWNDKTFWKERLYANDPAKELVAKGAELLVSINASPFSKSKIGIRRAFVSHLSKAKKIPVVFVNLVGGNDGVIFDGSSFVTDNRGEVILQAPAFEEYVSTVDLCIAHHADAPSSDGATYDAGTDLIRRALVLGIRDYAQKNRFSRVLIGLSGGIDSAVVTSLAAEAIGAENILALMMPSPFSSKGSIEDSERLCRNLGVQSMIQPISGAFELLSHQLGLTKLTRGGESPATENLQSRLRGNILMTISNTQGRLLLSTGNKSELALGYCTLYGDTNGGLAVIGDVLKTEVYELARHINRDREIIPVEIINKRPSAELAPDQFDDQSLPPYDMLDPILKLYFEQKSTPAEIIAQGHDADLVYEILNKVESPANEFKRRQLPPTLIISKNAIGIGRRRPVAHAYKREMKRLS